MITRLSEQKLVEIRLRHHSAPQPQFVDPHEIHKLGEVLDRRGEVWASSVLGRTLFERSVLNPKRPYFKGTWEVRTLIEADLEEDQQILSELEGE